MLKSTACTKNGKRGWKNISSPPSYIGMMRYTFKSRSDLTPVISNAPGARRAFVVKFDPKVREAAYRVNAKRPDKTVDDVYMDLWAHVFERDCRMLRGYSEKSSLEAYVCTCLGHKAMDIASNITRDADRFADNANDYMHNFQENQDDIEEDEERLWVQHIKSAHALVKSLSVEKGRFFIRAFVERAPTETLRKEFGLSSSNAVYQWKNRIRARLGSLVKAVCPVRSLY